MTFKLHLIRGGGAGDEEVRMTGTDVFPVVNVRERATQRVDSL